MKNIEQIDTQNQQRAWEIIHSTKLIETWQAVGATINLVGSLKTGLLVKHRDIDFHIYTDTLNIAESFAAISQLAQNPRIKQIQYGNLINTDEHCIEWHALYEDERNDIWQLDMIHIKRGSTYDGYFERVADRITAVLTDETRQAILRLKYETPENEEIMGVLYYRAVIEGGVRTYAEFTRWLNDNPADGVIEWIP